MRIRVVLTTVLAAAAGVGCELQEVTTAEPVRFAVAEVVLQAEADTQFAYLQSGVGPAHLRIEGARVRVFADGGADTLVFHETDAWRCISPLPTHEDVIGSCYMGIATSLPIRSGGEYRLRIDLPDGGQLSGFTRVPGPLQLLTPNRAVCALPPDTSLELRWRRAADTWVYAVEVQLHDIFPILVQRGVVADTANVPLRLSGLAISAGDTTLVLPGELGLFDRFDADVHPILLALRDGLPAGVRGEVLVGAADRNYVNWARGGVFNPSGVVRVPSVRGDGTGVFGSMSAARFSLRVTRDPTLPACR